MKAHLPVDIKFVDTDEMAVRAGERSGGDSEVIGTHAESGIK